MVKKDLQFYTELVVVTVLSLIAANLWIKVFSTYMEKYWKGNMIMYVFVGSLVSVFAIFLLNVFFSNEFNEDEKDKKI